VIVPLTTGVMIPSETNRLPDKVDTVIETLTTCVYLVWRSISLRGYHPPVVSVTITVSTSSGGLLVSECIIPPVVSVTITVTNRPPDEVDTVIVTLTTGGMIPSETNRPPDEVDTVIVTLTTWGMIHPPVVSVTMTVSTSSGGLLVSEGIIPQ
jgi:hypothetical protein